MGAMTQTSRIHSILFFSMNNFVSMTTWYGMIINFEDSIYWLALDFHASFLA